MYVSKKFSTFYESLSRDEKIDANTAIIALCDDHERYMQRKEREMKHLLEQALEAAAELDIEKLAAIAAEVERKKHVLTIEEFIEIHFGLR